MRKIAPKYAHYTSDPTADLAVKNQERKNTHKRSEGLGRYNSLPPTLDHSPQTTMFNSGIIGAYAARADGFGVSHLHRFVFVVPHWRMYLFPLPLPNNSL